MSDPQDVRLGLPKLRVWELNENSTRYDHLLAAPSDGELRAMWIGWSVISALAAFYMAVVILSICLSGVTRKNPFNNYLIYLTLPDIVFSSLCFITCALNASAGHYWASWMCRLQSFYVIWFVAANAWLNALILFQLHRLLSFSLAGRRFTVPTRRRVFLHAAGVYLYAAFIASWGMNWNVSWWPHKTVVAYGVACLPLEFSSTSTIFYYVAFVPLLAGLPVLYVIWVCYDLWKRNLMPPAGRRRILSIYFLRIVIVFVVMFTPYVIIVFVAKGSGGPWVDWAGGAWIHLQGSVSASMTLLKPDIKKAFFDFLSCRVNWKHDEVEDKQDDGFTRSSRAAGLSFRNLNASSKSFSVTANDDSLRTTKVRISEITENIEGVTGTMKSTDAPAAFNREQSPREADDTVEGFLPVKREHVTFFDEQDGHNEAPMSVTGLSNAIHLGETYSTEGGVTHQLPV